MKKENLHTHTNWCDGKDTFEALAETALAAGFDVLGFSGHSYTPFDTSYCMSRERMAAYPAAVRALAARYRGRLEILCGIEQDYFSGVADPAAGYAYVIGSVHAVFCPLSEVRAAASAEGAPGACEGADGRRPVPPGIIEAADGYYVYLDYDRDALLWAIRHLYGGDPLALAEAYFAHVARLPAVTGCQIIGHFDLLTKFNELPAARRDEAGPLNGGIPEAVGTAETGREPDATAGPQAGAPEKSAAPAHSLHSDAHTQGGTSAARAAGAPAPIFDTAAPRYRAAAERALHALLSTDVLFEINTGAMARGLRTTPYPAADLLRAIREGGGRILVSSDCHDRRYLDYGFDAAISLALACGFRESWILSEGRWQPQEFDF